MGHAASPFGDPVENEKSTDRFSIERGKKNDALHDRWREARKKSLGFADPIHPFRHQGSADINLYKAFLEQVHALLRHGGRMGFIVPSGLYSDHGTGGLRQLFLDQCRWEWLFNFINWNAIFPSIYYRFKFNAIIVQKGGTTEAINTAFVRTVLEDWERAEALATSYTRAQVERFNPRSRAILEIQSQRDLEILEKIYANSVLLGDDGPDGWGIKYAREFDMTNDSRLFPPRPKWEAEGYRPDEYSRWLKGDWRPIDELWEELEIDPSRVVPLDPSCETRLHAADVQQTDWRLRCAQPPCDSLPIPRADIRAGIILSREADAWIKGDRIEDVALPLYEGRMIGQFDFSQKGWVSGKGRSAKWRDIPFSEKRLEPQFCMGENEYLAAEERNGSPKALGRCKLAFMDVASATNERTMIASVVPKMPCGNSVPVLCMSANPWVLQSILNSFGYDFVSRRRCSGLHLNYFVIEDSPLPRPHELIEGLGFASLRVGGIHPCFSDAWLRISHSKYRAQALKSMWSGMEYERRRQLAITEALAARQLGLSPEDMSTIIKECDRPRYEIDERRLLPNGFWRADKDKDPELRHTVLTLVAFHDLEEKIRSCGGDREKGIEAFLNQNNGEGWMLPETLRLADYGLGHDERAKEHQPVSSRLGPRFYDWQLAQTPEESWRECHIHARNLLGEGGYLDLLGEVLANAAEGKWAEALTFACALSKKENLLYAFEAALGALTSASWRNRLDEARSIMAERGFTLEPDDRVLLLFGATRRAPEGKRSEALKACGDLLDRDGLRTVMRRLLALEPCTPDGPWHTLFRETLDLTDYRALLAEMDGGRAVSVAEPASAYDVTKMTQRRLFE